VAGLAQVIAAVATGALLTVAIMLVFRVYGAQCRAERERRIEAATIATVTGVETLRQQARADPGESFPLESEGAVEVRSKAHLRMLVTESQAAPWQVGCIGPAPEDRTTRRQRVRESRR
jgi:hypothetical protein